MDESAAILIFILVGLLFGNAIADRLERRSRQKWMEAHLAYLDSCLQAEANRMRKREEGK